MQSKPSIRPVFRKVMEETGFYRDGKPTPGVLDAGSLLRNKKLIDKSFTYAPVLDPNNLGAAAVFELDGSPCVYFKWIEGQTPFPTELARIHRIAWNHGLAPLLWVITETEVLIYSCYSKPARKDEADPVRHLVERFKTTAPDLKRLNEFAGRLAIETGRIWEDDRLKKVDRDQRVDRSLLKDLTENQEKLSDAGLVPAVARGLLGRSILAVWLQDRGILTRSFFRTRYKVDRFDQVLKDKEATYDLFRQLDETFHGNIFPLVYAGGKPFHEQDIVRPEHLEIVRKMLEGRRIKRGVKQAWVYNFDVIPVEFISSIYEMFTAAGGSKVRPVRSTRYTPLNIVDLVLSNVFADLKKEGNILDMSCGSGVFLVEAFRRLVARRVAAGEKWTRELVRDILHHRLHGLDVNPDALQIAAFCLYLTALELDPDLQAEGALDFKPLVGTTLIAADAFDGFAPFNVKEPFRSRDFAAIVGNPPWTRCKDKGLAWDYCRQHRYPLARSDTPDQAFMWRTARFAGENTLIGLVLHASAFFSHAKPALKAKRALLTLFTPTLMINLCDLRQDGLFEKSIAPGLVFIARGRRAEDDDHFRFARPERIDHFKRHGIIRVRPHQYRTLPVVEAANDPDLLKVASWATVRDIALVRKIREGFPSLEKFCNRLHCRKGLNRGQGFQLTNGNKEVPELHGLPWLESGKLSAFAIDAARLPKLPPMNFLSPRNPGIYWGPLVITVRGIGQDGFKAAFAEENVVYTEEYYGFSFAASDAVYAHYLNAIFNSCLASYYLFLTASVWGIERDKIEPNDLMGLPIPPMDPATKPKTGRVLRVESEILESLTATGSAPEVLRRRLDEAVFDLYGLSDLERTLIVETVRYTLDVKNRRDKSHALKAPKAQELVPYAEQMLSLLDGKAAQAQVFDIPASPLMAVKFSANGGTGKAVQSIARKDVYSFLKELAEEVPLRPAQDLCSHNFLYFTHGADTYIIKPAQRRCWTLTAALHDAEALSTSPAPPRRNKSTG